MNRRDFLRMAGAGFATALLSRTINAQPAESNPVSKPNILVIMSDEHNASVTGCYGNKIVKTPVIDSLAARGVVFENCYTASPLCVPARLAFTMGRYISRVGAWSNDCKIIDEKLSRLPQVLADAGYETVLCGKMHYDRNQKHGFQVELSPQGNNRSSMNGKGHRRNADDLAPSKKLSGRFKDFRIGNDNQVIAHDIKVTDTAEEYLKSRKKDGKPFFMLAGYVAPHFPLIVPEKYWKMYKDKVPMPEIPQGFLDSLPLNYKHLRAGFELTNVPADTVKLGRELYYGFVTWLDEQIGKLLATLGSSEDAGNTIVIYTTDHGENMGEHGLWWKNAMYEHADRVPFIISYPPLWKGGQRRTGACSHLDIVQTIAELAGAGRQKDWNGDSLLPWLADGSYAWKDQAVSQYYAHNIASGYVMIRKGKYKYVYHSPPDNRHPSEHELYDLEKDPGEFINLATKPENRETVNSMLAAIIKETGEHPDETEKRCRAQYATGYPGTENNTSKNEEKNTKKKRKKK